MGESVKHVDSSLPPDSVPGWKMLGELQLAPGDDSHHTVDKWLGVILSRLELQEDLVNKVLRSAWEAVGRALQTAQATRFDHLHVIVFVRADLTARHRSWGFFRIEKVETEDVKETPDHAIELYLYPEGS
jgi:hypothetical protein